MAYKQVTRPLNSNDSSVADQLGQVQADGSNGKLYKYVKVVDLALQKGDSVELASATYSYIVSKDRSGGSVISGRGVVGVAVATVSVGQYGYVQVGGQMDEVRCDGGVAAGDYLIPHASQDGRADTTTTAAGIERTIFGRALAADSTATSTTAVAKVLLKNMI